VSNPEEQKQEQQRRARRQHDSFQRKLQHSRYCGVGSARADGASDHAVDIAENVLDLVTEDDQHHQDDDSHQDEKDGVLDHSLPFFTLEQTDKTVNTFFDEHCPS
jgi:hypothetical protein